MTEPGFWDDQDNAQQVIDEMNGLKKTVQELDKLSEELENLDVSYELTKKKMIKSFLMIYMKAFNIFRRSSTASNLKFYWVSLTIKITPF